jgi:A/G-specific adenine glycosylase
MNESFIAAVWNYYSKNKRHFPWRETSDPYFIFLSEMCLQQTQTSRVVLKYQELIDAFPTVTKLSEASFSHVLSYWSGLGYNRRAKYVLESAKIIVEKYAGVFPSDPHVLDELPGVGFNTAAAVVVYAFNIPVAFIETNIRRVYIHHYFQEKEQVTDEAILSVVHATMDRQNPREWFWALMDYGSFLAKSIDNPNRKSNRYTKQSTFLGSAREVRGSILKTLLVAPHTYQGIEAQMKGDKKHLEKALQALHRENLIVVKDGLYSLV